MEQKQSKALQKKQFGELCTQAVDRIANTTYRRKKEVDDAWYEAVKGKKAPAHSTIINKYKSGKSLPKNISDVDWLIKSVIDLNDENFSQDWIEKICKCLNYRNDELINEPCITTSRQSTANMNINSNLPPSIYTQFVERAILSDIIDGLKGYASLILIKSIGGNGKTSLVFEIAIRCTSSKLEYENLPKFQSIVWISGKENLIDSNIQIFDTIAQSLGYKDMLKDTPEDKERQIMDILKSQAILVIVDNFETFNNKDQVSEFLLKIPSPSKCIVTTREICDKFDKAAIRGNCIIHRIDGMSQDEARKLITNKARGIIEIDNISDFDNLIKKVEGNPMAICMALGYMRQRRLTIDEVSVVLLNMSEDFMTDLFNLSWSLLDNDEQNLLMILSLFPNATDKPFLINISEIPNIMLQNKLNNLINLSLLNDSHKANTIYYHLHSLTKEFASQKLEEYNEKESIMDKCMFAYIELTNSIIHCHKEANTEDLKMLDKDWFKEGLEYIVDWAMDNQKYSFVIKVTDNVKYYFYIRGVWSSQLNLIRAKAANRISDIQTEFDAYVYHLNILCKQENSIEISKLLPEIESLKNLHQSELSKESLIDFQHDLALYNNMKGSYKEAIKLWQGNLDNAVSKRQVNTNKRWLGIAYYKDGDFEEAEKFLKDIANEVNTEKYNHNSLSAHLYMCKIYLKRNDRNSLNNISIGLEKSKDSKDSFHKAEFEFLLAKYHFEKEGKERSESYFNDAITSFQKIGCFNRVAEIEIYIKNNNL